MGILKCTFVVFFVICGSCEESHLEESEEISRVLRDDFKQNQWRAVENINLDTSGWIPDESSHQEASTESFKPKRRRLRKRKRRPLIHSFTDGGAELIEDRLPPRRIRRPQILNEDKEPWKEMEEESGMRPNKRRRIIPLYQETPIVYSGTLSATLQYGQKDRKPVEKFSDSIDVFQADEGITETRNSSTPEFDLKRLLKQTGGLSLSEILQQKNLSLADLLNGERQAIMALTEKPERGAVLSEKPDGDIITEYKNPVEIGVPEKPKYSSNYRRFPLKRKTKPNIDHEVVSTHSSVTEEQDLLLNEKQNIVYTDQIKYNIEMEEATERIFVPSHPKYYTSLDYKPDIIAIDVHTTEKSSNTETLKAKNEELRNEILTSKPPVNESQQKIAEDEGNQEKMIEVTKKGERNSSEEGNHKTFIKHILPITNAKLHEKVKTANEKTTIPPNAFTINLGDLFGLSDLLSENVTIKNEEGPIRMSLDLNDFSQNVTIKPSVEISEHTTEKCAEKTTANHILSSTKPASTTTKPVPEKMKTITAKDEIMEMLRDDTAKDNLSKILASRNMTIEELVEQRERGSSQRHLADIFHNKTKEPEPKDEPHVGQIRSERPLRPFVYFERKSKSRVLPLELKKDSQGSQYVTSVAVEPIEESNESKVVEENKDKNKYIVTSFPMYKIEMDKRFKDKPRVPAWKTAYPSIYSEASENSYRKDTEEDLNDFENNELHRLDLIENTISEAINDELNVDVNNNIYNDDYDDPFIRLPYGVKSAIFASLLIIGISLLLFLTILMVFKWSQRHKKKLCYTNSLSCSKIKSPILEEQPKRTIRTFMTETLGRKKHYYKQNMSDSIWDNDRKPFQ